MSRKNKINMTKELELVTIESIRRLRGASRGEALRKYYGWVKEQREKYRKQYGLPEISGERRGFTGRYGLKNHRNNQNKRKRLLSQNDNKDLKTSKV